MKSFKKSLKKYTLIFGVVLFLISLMANVMYSNKVCKLENDLREQEISTRMIQQKSWGDLVLDGYHNIKEKFTD